MKKLIGENQSIFNNLNLYKDRIKNINHYEAFRCVVGYTPVLGKKYKSLFRADSDPGCRYEMKNGVLYFVDNAGYNGKLFFSIFDVLKELKGFSFKESCAFLLQENIMSDAIVTQFSNHPIKIRFRYNPWKGDEDFLKDYKISAQYMNNQPYYLVSDYWTTSRKDPSFRKNNLYNPKLFTTIAYHFKESNNVKLYWYKGDKDRLTKFFTNCVNDDLYGLHRLHEYDYNAPLWIVKSGKEDCILNYHLGFNTIGVQSESIEFPQLLLDICADFPEIIIAFDNDETGKMFAQQRKSQLKKIYPDKSIYTVYVPSPLNDIGNIVERNFDLASVIANMYNHATNERK